ncbi:hypothetical protein BCR44DRAFT_38089 [Catenaria anguillulae PL171]|uniref:Uncharacterized protein n=1 Tax=Catenaria anguillulae PL171 TaxID=765915 RepID=A0A1Y2I392_9FUNG|nr:hypothetical protein BCR44DRAFT_38089 [Catenaria anguillulae PL171]
MATFAHNKEHQDLIMNQPIAESSAVWENEPAAPSSPPTMDIDRPTTPEPAPAAPPTSAPATPFDSEPTIRAPVDLPTFDYAQFHKVHVHGSPAADTQTLIETGQSAVERAQEMVRKSQAAANARAASHVVPETPMAPRGVASATPSTVGSDTLTPATPTVRPGRVPERQHQAVDSHVASTPEHTRRVRDAGHTPAPHPRGAKPVAAAANARTPYATQQTPKRTTRAAAAAAAAAASTPASPGPAPYNFRHKPVAATVAPDAHVSPARPAVTRRNVKRTASQVDTSAVVSPAKTPKRTGTAAAAADTTPKPAANARGTRVGLRSAGATSLTGEAAEQQGPGSPSSRAAGAAGGRATRRATLGAAGAAVVAAVGSRRATLGQQQEVGVGAAGSRPKRAATAGKKK